MNYLVNCFFYNAIEKMTRKKINVIDASVDNIDLKLKELGFEFILNINSSDKEDLINQIKENNK